MLKVLMVSSEGVPFAKTGGLADVIGSLPLALKDKDVDARIIMPFYAVIPQELRNMIIHKKNIYVEVGWRSQFCGIWESNLNGITFYFIDNQYYFGRENIYSYHDEGERFAFFCRAVLESLPHLGFEPDILHCHDWQSGMVPVFLDIQYHNNEFYQPIKTLFTIHNLQYQGVFPRNILSDLLNIGENFFTSDKLEFFGDVNFMKGGLVYSNRISTVSPTYALEIQDPYYGEKLDGLLRARSHELYGILNGIDYKDYNPSSDAMIDVPYSQDNLAGKVENKIKLQEQLGLEISKDIPVIGVVSRLVPQKGLDLVACVLDEIMTSEVELVILGNGFEEYERFFTDASLRYRRRLSSVITFDNKLAHRIYAGADMFLMPSKFEPSGLGQMIALRYGTIPVVRETGGLKDTVQSFNEFTMEGNGFTFTAYNAHDMLFTIRRALSIYHNSEVWDMLVKGAMACNFSWDLSASEYVKVYNLLRK